MMIWSTGTTTPRVGAVAELPHWRRTLRTTLVVVTSLRSLHRLVVLTLVVSLVNLTMTLLARVGL